MPAYPIEVINLGSPEKIMTDNIINELNELQQDIFFSNPPEHLKYWGVPFERENYTTQYVWEKLREYKTSSKGFHPYILAIVHGKLSSENLSNLFASRSQEESFAVVTTDGWEELYAPPSLEIYLMYYFIRYTISFICPEIKNHVDTRNCFFDKKIHKPDIKLSMKSCRICDSCKSTLEKWIDGHTYNSILKLIHHLNNRVNNHNIHSVKRHTAFVGSSSEGLKIAEHIQIGLEDTVDTTIWSQDIFALSKGNLENLANAVKKFEYAILVLTPDDLSYKRGSMEKVPRDNVLFELGLFMGALGRDRTFMVYCKDEQINLPTDLAGITAATYKKRDDSNLSAAIGPVCTKLKQVMGVY